MSVGKYAARDAQQYNIYDFTREQREAKKKKRKKSNVLYSGTHTIFVNTIIVIGEKKTFLIKK